MAQFNASLFDSILFGDTLGSHFNAIQFNEHLFNFISENEPDLITEPLKPCSLAPFDIATFGLRSYSLNISVLGLLPSCQTCLILSGECSQIDLIVPSNGIELDISCSTGECSQIDLIVPSNGIELDISCSTGECSQIDLIKKNYGASQLQVIDIIDSRRNITFTILINKHIFTKTFKIPSIILSNIQIQCRFKMSIKNSISVEAINVVNECRNSVMISAKLVNCKKS